MHQTQKTLYVVAMCSTVSRLDTLVQEMIGGVERGSRERGEVNAY